MAWDLYQTFGQRAVFSQIRSRKYFKSYTLYATCIPMLIVGLATGLDFMAVLEMDYGDLHYCWIGDLQGFYTFFATPICFILVSNAYMYAKTIASIRYVAKKLEGIEKHTLIFCLIPNGGGTQR